MKLSINPKHFIPRRDGTNRGLSLILKEVKQAGFDCVDILVSKAELSETIKLLEKNNLTVNQSHSPFFRYEKTDYKEAAKKIMNAAECAYELGSKIFVVHGDEFDIKNMEYSHAAALDFNYNFFAPVAEYLAKHDMKIAFENLFYDGFGIPRFCSSPEELIAITDRFPRDVAGICWDTGHGKVADEKNYIKNMASVSDRIISTHIHDNDHEQDLHLFPFLGNLDWDNTIKVLKDNNYGGEFTYEFVYDRIPDEFLPDILSILFRMGKYITNK